jgi:aromatic-L-amino-acid/L-tryptophan decarboxylase
MHKNEDHNTLDPQDWDAMKALMHTMVDDTFEHIKTVRDRAPWTPVPESVKKTFTQAVPRAGIGAENTYEEFKEKVLQYPMGNIHPKFWAWYMGNGTMMGAMAEYLTGIINPNAGAGNHIAQHVENQVIDWMKSIIGYPDSASGILASGGTMANYVGLATARHAKSGYDIRTLGILEGQKQLTLYASTEVHNCNQKATELLGIGGKYLRKIPVKSDFTIDLEILQKTIDTDKAAGMHPICIIGSAGTVNTGAIDDLNALADIAKKENMWFHVDGAIGGIAMISPDVKPKLSGIERSDSVALDLHKWLHIPFEAGCVLVRDRKTHRDTFNVTAEYLMEHKRGLASGQNWYSEYGLQLSRRFNALKVWMSIKEQGIDRYGEMISKNVDQAQYLGQLIDAHDQLELMAPIGLDIVCYRFNPGDLDYAQLNELNQEIIAELHERGIAIPSYTTLKGNYCIRVAIANHRSRHEDFTDLAHATVTLGNELISQFS